MFLTPSEWIYPTGYGPVDRRSQVVPTVYAKDLLFTDVNVKAALSDQLF